MFTSYVLCVSDIITGDEGKHCNSIGSCLSISDVFTGHGYRNAVQMTAALYELSKCEHISCLLQSARHLGISTDTCNRASTSTEQSRGGEGALYIHFSHTFLIDNHVGLHSSQNASYTGAVCDVHQRLTANLHICTICGIFHTEVNTSLAACSTHIY